MERELQYGDREVVLEHEIDQNYEYQQREVQTQVQYLAGYEEMLMQKFRGSGQSLKVYVDQDNDKYYVDAFAAFSLGLISYMAACKITDNGQELYEISRSVLKVLEKVFHNAIEYVILPSKMRDMDREYEYGSNPEYGNLPKDDMNHDFPDNYDYKDHEKNTDTVNKKGDLSEFFDDSKNDITSQYDEYKDNIIKM